MGFGFRRFVVAALPAILVWLFVFNAPARAGIGVVASIKPVHSLVSSIMKGVGEPALIVTGAGSPHAYSLKPSQAAALENAALIFWIGHDLEAFLEAPLETLAGKARVIALGDVAGLEKLPLREGGAFEAHDHEHEEDADHGHDSAHIGHADDDHGEHGHGETDMHLWLDPENARAMARAILAGLVEADPANADTYRANAKALDAGIAALSREIDARLSPVRDKPFIVFHDGYRYFEKRFALRAAGSVTVNPQTMPGAARVAEIRGKIASLDVACVFAEPQFDDRLVAVLIEGTKARAGVLDPLGAALDDGPALYGELLRGMAKSVAGCLGG